MTLSFIYALMKRKDTESCKKVFEVVVEYAKLFHIKINFSTPMMTDFQASNEKNCQ